MVGRVARPQAGNCGCAKHWDRTLQGERVKGPGEELAQEEGKAVEAGRPSRWVDGVTWDVDFVLRASKRLAGVGQGSDNG